MPRICVMASGSGTILKAMIDGKIPIKLVVTDRKCPARDIAIAAGISTVCVDRRDFGYKLGIGENWGREGFTLQVLHFLEEFKIDLVPMAGFFTILHPVIFERFKGDILNIHPSLLPAFKGETAVRDALEAGVSETGSTVHIATAVLDDATYIVAQVGVDVLDEDTVETLWERIKVEERILYVKVIRGILEGSINLNEVKKRLTARSASAE